MNFKLWWWVYTARCSWVSCLEWSYVMFILNDKWMLCYTWPFREVVWRISSKFSSGGVIPSPEIEESFVFWMEAVMGEPLKCKMWLCKNWYWNEWYDPLSSSVWYIFWNEQGSNSKYDNIRYKVVVSEFPALSEYFYRVPASQGFYLQLDRIKVWVIMLLLTIKEVLGWGGEIVLVVSHIKGPCCFVVSPLSRANKCFTLCFTMCWLTGGRERERQLVLVGIWCLVLKSEIPRRIKQRNLSCLSGFCPSSGLKWDKPNQWMMRNWR